VPRPRLSWWAAAALVFAFPCLAAPARAQVAISASADSDYRLRGVSISDGRPTVSATVAYDHSSGAYGGLTVVAVATRHSGVQALGYDAYAGYAHRVSPDLSLEIGIVNSDVAVYLDHRYSANYTEIYAGLAHGNISAHIYFSPHYIIGGASTVYAELDGAFRPIDRWRVFGHAGILTILGAPDQSTMGRERFDVRAGIAREFKHCELRLTWTTTTPQPLNPDGYGQTRSALVAGVTIFY
jgi:uncharacterized protein (TIGR02001 family)